MGETFDRIKFHPRDSSRREQPTDQATVCTDNALNSHVSIALHRMRKTLHPSVLLAQTQRRCDRYANFRLVEPDHVDGLESIFFLYCGTLERRILYTSIF